MKRSGISAVVIVLCGAITLPLRAGEVPASQWIGVTPTPPRQRFTFMACRLLRGW